MSDTIIVETQKHLLQRVNACRRGCLQRGILLEIRMINILCRDACKHTRSTMIFEIRFFFFTIILYLAAGKCFGCNGLYCNGQLHRD